MSPAPALTDQASSLDHHITDLGGLIALALALVTVFTTVRAQRSLDRDSQTGLTRDSMLGQVALDLGLVVLTIGVILAAAPLFVGAVKSLAIGHERGALRLTFAIVWVLLIALAIWQLMILRRTVRTTSKVWTLRAPQ
jgi:hypothetical protein